MRNVKWDFPRSKNCPQFIHFDNSAIVLCQNRVHRVFYPSSFLGNTRKSHCSKIPINIVFETIFLENFCQCIIIQNFRHGSAA